MNDLKQKSTLVAELHQEHDEAIDEVRRLEAQVLREAIATVLPALPALSGKIAGTPRPGLLLWQAVCVLDEGTLYHINTGRIVSAEEAVQIAHARVMVQALDDALERQIKGKLGTAIDKLEAKAERIKMMLKGLRG